MRYPVTVEIIGSNPIRIANLMLFLMFKPTYLYIKIHNKTGLKYFGKTSVKDPYKYAGSGVYWKKHIRKHGFDISTEIIGYYIDEEECRNDAIRFSEENDIVESDEWANLKEESLDGGWDFVHENKLHYGFSGKKHSNETKQIISSKITGKKHSEKTKEKISKNNFSKRDPDLQKNHAKKAALKSHKNTRTIHQFIKDKTSKTLVEMWSSKKQTSCPHCGKSGLENSVGMNRWHFNNCKYKA
jgi:NUMOD3 motif